MIDPTRDDAADRSEQYRQQDIDKLSPILEKFLFGIGAIAIGYPILRKGFRGATGNLIADLLTYINHGPIQGRGIGASEAKFAMNAGATAQTARGVRPGSRTILDAVIDTRSGRLLLDDADLIKDIAYAQEVLGSVSDESLRKVLKDRLIQSVESRFRLDNSVSFFGHKYQRLTVKEVLADRNKFSSLMSAQKIEAIEAAHKEGLISADLALDKAILVNKQANKIYNVSLRKPLRKLLNTLDFFGQGRVLRALIGEDVPYAVLPPRDFKGAFRYYITGDIFVAYRGKSGGVTLKKIAEKTYLRRSGDPLALYRALSEGRAVISPPPEKMGPLQKALEKIGLGSRFRTVNPLYKTIILPFIRARKIATREAVFYKKARIRTGEFGGALRDIIGAQSPEVISELGKLKKVSGGGRAYSPKEIPFFRRLLSYLGLDREFIVVKKSAAEARTASKEAPILAEHVIGGHPTGAVTRVESAFKKGTEISPLFVKEAASAGGDILTNRTAAFYAAPAGILSRLKDFAGFLSLRLNSLASFSLLGIGFKPSRSILVNLSRVAAIPIVYNTLYQTAGYLDFVMEELTGISPVKTIASAYAGLRVAQQHLRETLGIRPLAAALERNYPGSVDSEAGFLLRTILSIVPGARALASGRSYLTAALLSGVTYGLIGGPALSQPPQELEEEYKGIRRVPVRRGAFWGLGYNPFFGGDISHFEPSWYVKLMSDARTKSIYGSRKEYYSKYANVFGIPLPTPHSLFGLRQLLDPYALEKKHYYTRPYPVTGGRFDEFPIIGPALSYITQHFPVIGKPIKRMHTEELLGIPVVGQDLADKGLPYDLANRLGISDLPKYANRIYRGDDIKTRMQLQAAIASEPLGIYKFALEYFGVDLSAALPGTEATSTAIGSLSREFHSLNLGGLFGQTEFLRRFLLTETGLASRQRQLINPLRNAMPTWLPGVGSENLADQDYMIDFLHGDPFAKLPGGEYRLPGDGYESIYTLHSGKKGYYDEVDRLLILADVAPYSRSFKEALQKVDFNSLSPEWQRKIRIALEEREKVINGLRVYQRYGFYENPPPPEGSLEEKLSKALDLPKVRQIYDDITHNVLAQIPYFGTKLFPFRDAAERYRKEVIFGAEFADWKRPMETIIGPAALEMSSSGIIGGALKGAGIGALMLIPGAQYLMPLTPLKDPVKSIFAFSGVGAVLGAAKPFIFDEKGLPREIRKVNEAQEYMDKFLYLKYRGMQLRAEELGDQDLAESLSRSSKATIVGAQGYSDIRAALSSTDRKYFNTFLGYPVGYREKLLSTLPDYYSKALYKVWNRDYNTIEEADKETLDYFSEEPLVSTDSLLWHPSVPSTAVKIRMIEGGLKGVSDNLHKFGFYESQKIEADQRFPSVHYSSPYSFEITNIHTIINRMKYALYKMNPFDDHPERTMIRSIYSSTFSNRVEVESKINRSNQVYAYVGDYMR